MVVEKSGEEQGRKQHFHNSALYEDYYRSLIDSPDLWCPQSQFYTGWRQLEAMGLMSETVNSKYNAKNAADGCEPRDSQESSTFDSYLWKG